MRFLIAFILIHLFYTACSPINRNPNEDKNSAIENSRSSIIEKKLTEADSIILAQHLGRDIKNSKNGIQIPPVLPVIENGLLNYKIITKRVLLSKVFTDSLIQILSDENLDTSFCKCEFDPHQTIYIIKKDNISFIDICFRFRIAAVSDDLKEYTPYSTDKFKRLEQVFIKNGIDITEDKK